MTITIQTDDSIYEIREEILITGTVDPLAGNKRVVIEVTNSAGKRVERMTTRPRSDGTYTTRNFRKVTGTYTYTATYSGEQASVQVTINAPIPQGEVRVTDLKVLNDTQTAEVVEMDTGKMYVVSFEVHNDRDVELQATSTVSIEDGGGISYMGDSGKIQLDLSESRQVRVFITPTQPASGPLKVQIFDTNAGGAAILATPASLDIEVADVPIPPTLEERVADVESRVTALEQA